MKVVTEYAQKHYEKLNRTNVTAINPLDNYQIIRRLKRTHILDLLQQGEKPTNNTYINKY